MTVSLVGRSYSYLTFYFHPIPAFLDFYLSLFKRKFGWLCTSVTSRAWYWLAISMISISLT